MARVAARVALANSLKLASMASAATGRGESEMEVQAASRDL